MDLDYVHDYLVQEAVLRHHSPQGGFYYPVFEELEERAFEEATPDQIFLTGLPLDLFDGVEHLHVSLEDEGQHLEEQRDEVRDVRVLAEVSDRQNRNQRPHDEQELPEELPKLQTRPLEILGHGHAGNKLDLLAIGKELEHLGLEVLLAEVHLLQPLEVLLDPLELVVGGLLLLLLSLLAPRVFLEVDIGGVVGVAIGAVKLAELEYELDHLGCDEELLEDGRLLAVLGEDEELGQELQGFEVLKRESLFEGLVEVEW